MSLKRCAWSQIHQWKLQWNYNLNGGKCYIMYKQLGFFFQLKVLQKSIWCETNCTQFHWNFKKNHDFDEQKMPIVTLNYCFLPLEFLKHYVFILWIKDNLHVLILIFNYTVIDFFLYLLTGSGLGLGWGRSRINGGHKKCSFPFMDTLMTDFFKSYMYVSLYSIR